MRETSLSRADLIHPLFIRSGRGQVQPIPSMPGHAQRSVDMLQEEIADLRRLGIKAVLLFGLPATKDSVGGGAWDSDGAYLDLIHKAHCP